MTFLHLPSAHSAVGSRLLYAGSAGILYALLGTFTLLKNHHHRLNRQFALFNFSFAFRNLSAYFFIFFSHETALPLYRLSFLAEPLSQIFLLSFIHELAGISTQAGPKIHRRILWLILVAVAPIYPTRLFMVDVYLDAARDLVRKPGPLLLLNLILIATFNGIAAWTAFHQYRMSSGIKRNQLKFIVLGMSLLVMAFAFYLLAVVRIDLPWTYFPLQMLTSFCFAYAIFKYRLFEFTLWMRRAAIFAGMYVALASIPFFLYYFRSQIPGALMASWAFFPVVTVGYAILFSIAPALNTFLRDKAEEKRWATMHEQMTVIVETAERLASEREPSAQKIADSMLDVLRDFYWNRMHNPLNFILVAVLNEKEELSLSIYPDLEIEPDVLDSFLKILKTSLLSNEPFSPIDLTQRIATASQLSVSEALLTLKNYLVDNKIEFCCPCVHNGRFFGALMMGPKERGIFWPEELKTLRIAASNVAVAARKSELIERTKELHDLDQLKRDLIANITHEFKSPLSVVEGAIDVLLDDMKEGRLTNESVSEFLLMVRNNTGRLSMFIQNLLEIAKIDQMKIDLRRQETSLADIVNDAVALMKPLADKKGLRLLFDAGPDMLLDVDGEKIHQVVCNLISNAIKFTDEGSVTIAMETRDNAILLSVKDTGRGIEPAYRDAIFDRFFQAPSKESKRPKGTGLGLAIAKGWTEAHGGKIWVESDGLGKGATFFVELPTEAARSIIR